MSNVFDVLIAMTIAGLAMFVGQQYLHIVDLEDYRDTHYEGHLDCDSEISAQVVSMQTGRLYCELCEMVNYGNEP